MKNPTFGKSIDSVKNAVAATFKAEGKAAKLADTREATLTESVVYSFPSATPSESEYKAHRKALTIALAPLYTARRSDRDADKGKQDASRAISQCVETAHDAGWFVNPMPPRADKVVDPAAKLASDAADRIKKAIAERLQVKGKSETERMDGWASLIALDYFDPGLQHAFTSARVQAKKKQDADAAKQQADMEAAIMRKLIAEGKVIAAS